MDFFTISTRSTKRGVVEIYPKFIIKSPSNDLMIRGGDFYAVWLEDQGLWSTDEQAVLQIIDSELDKYYNENASRFDGHVKVLHMWDAESGMIDIWHKYCQKQMRDNFKNLDETLVWANSGIRKRDYASKRLPYALEEGDYSAYDKLMGVLYSPEERHKIEWAIGSIVSGDSKKIQKFLVLYGAAGTGKSTVLNIIQQLFEGYYCVFDARALGSSSNSFALESFKTNPLVAIQHDGDLSHIEDNTRLNSLVSHEMMTVNNKFEKLYSSRFKAFLFMGTNKPVKITDAKSGLIRRLIDVTPTGEKVSAREYKQLTQKITFELGAIAKHCEEVYLEDADAYDDYIPIGMLGASNDFYNFVSDSSLIFQDEAGVTLKQAWEMYKVYCDEAKVPYPLSKMKFKEELKNYFKEYEDRHYMEDGSRVRSLYSGFRKEKFENDMRSIKDLYFEDLGLKEQESLIDILYADCPAQYASPTESPKKAWDEVKTKLKQLDTHKLHYVRIPENHIVIDFDIPDKEGNKSLDRNIEEAAKWPQTYAELSKGGKGVHLHYIYDGDVSQLSSVYAEHIEIKVFKGKSALRRRLSLCNDIPVATISSGLPLKVKKGEKMVNFENVKNEKELRDRLKKMIIRNLNKEYCPGTKPSIDFIDKLLNDAYNTDIPYDVSDMYQGVLDFAMNSTNQAQYCIKKTNQMKWKSKSYEDKSAIYIPDDEPESVKKDYGNKRDVIFDIEVKPNLLLICWKYFDPEGKDKKVFRMVNPNPHAVEELMHEPLVGFNCRRYDNHIIYARMMGYSLEQCYGISKRIINTEKGTKSDAFFAQAYGVSKLDLYDVATKKQSLKKWEIELDQPHEEMDTDWNAPIPEDQLDILGVEDGKLDWDALPDDAELKVMAKYCDNDVLATEAVYRAIMPDVKARHILADISGLSINDTNRAHITKILTGGKKSVDHQYTDLSTIFPGYEYVEGEDRKMHNMYRGTDVGFGGYVYAEPGMYTNVALLDVGNMHGASIVALNKFGVDTQKYIDIREARMAIKEGIKTGDFTKAKSMMNGLLAPYLTSEEEADALQNALKLVLNSTYGIAAATFDNPLKDPRDVNNIIALRGALFMRTLQDEVQKRGFTVAHIKTDSIKVPNATQEIIDFIFKFGEQYGYEFEHECTYEKMCLVNDAVYIAKYDDKGVRNKGGKKAGKWTATGTQFQVPYVFKTLFSHEEIEFADLCETKTVSKGELYLDNNESLPNVEAYEKELKKLKDKGEDTTELEAKIAEGHRYIFIGRVGNFCPVKPGTGGGLLYRKQDGKYYAASGTKGYRWRESTTIKTLGKEADIDESYYISLCDEAKESISQYGDFEWFVSDEPVAKEVDIFMNLPEGLDDEIPWDQYVNEAEKKGA